MSDSPPSLPLETPPPIALRFSRAEWPAVCAAAGERGLSVGQFARDSAVAAASASNPLVRLSSARRRRRQLAPEDVAAVSRLTAHVARTNGAVVQLAMKEREAGRVETHAEIEAVLRDLRETQIALVACVERLS